MSSIMSKTVYADPGFTAMETMEDVEAIGTNLFNGRTVYVRDEDCTVKYESGKWVQCGENIILNEGLISGVLYVNQVLAG